LRGGLTDEEYRWKTIRRWGKALMVGKRVQFDDETWQAIEAVADDTGKAFQAPTRRLRICLRSTSSRSG
jgi:hypothetical protein